MKSKTSVNTPSYLDNIIVCIISSGRPFRVKPMQDMVGKAIWFVPQDEIKDYKNCEMILVDKGLSESRNTALEYCFKKDKICLMLDDDITGFSLLRGGNNKPLPSSFHEALHELYIMLIDSPFKLSALSDYQNNFFFHPRKTKEGWKGLTSLRSPLATTMIMVRQSTPRFDTKLEVNEDTDFTLQHIVKYGGALKINYIKIEHNISRMNAKTLQFKKTIEGGITKTIEKQIQACDYLKKKWGKLVKDSKVPYQVKFNL